MLPLLRKSLLLAAIFALAACSDSPTEAPVENPSVAYVQVGPQNNTITVGDTILLVASPKNAEGDPINGLPVQWSSSNNDVVQLTARGQSSLIRAQAAGTADIFASAAGKQGRATVTIIEAEASVAAVEIVGGVDSAAIGDQVRYDAIVRAANGEVIAGRTVHWQVSDVARLTLAGPADGSFVVATTRSAGPVTLTATVEGKQAARGLIVKSPVVIPVASISFEPSVGVITLFTLDTHQLRARAFAADGSELFGRPITWTSSDQSVATVSGTGLVTAAGVGAALVTASVEGQSAQISIDARSRIARIVMNPGSLVLPPGDHADIDATARAEDNSILQRTMTWTSSNAAVASVDAQGKVTAHAQGTAIIKASAEGQEAWTDVRVVEWVSTPLRTVGDSLLPATLFTRNGSRTVAYDGQFELAITGVNSGRYRLAFWVRIDNANGGTFGGLIYNGTFTYDLVTGLYRLSSYNGEQLTASRTNDGKAIVTGALEPNTPALTLTYSVQE